MKLEISLVTMFTALSLFAQVYPTPRSVIPLEGDSVLSSLRTVWTKDASLGREAYELKIQDNIAEIRSSTPTGEFYGEQTLAQLKNEAEDGKVKNQRILDAPAIPFRGVVEGYYGRPWGTEGRISLINFMGKYKMNTFIYGPKDDPYHHAKWRESYPEAQREDFVRLLRISNFNHINFYWAIHLGGTFAKGGEKEESDFSALFRKLGEMYDLGIRSFAVFFDDFGDADGDFHARICNRIYKDFLDRKGDCTQLVVCPNVYWGLGDHPYNKALGAALDKRAAIMWTGATICSDIRKADAEKIAKANLRPAFVWWNWPVNDYCRSKILLGRTYGLEYADYAGFVSNPMENCEANKIALFGIADWTWNPRDFDSEKNWNDSFTHIFADPEIAWAMKIFAENNSDQHVNSHGYRREESAKWTNLCAKSLAEYKQSGTLTPETIHEDWLMFNEIQYATDVLIKKLPLEYPQLFWELEGWLEAEWSQMDTGKLMLRYLEAQNDSERQDVIHQLATRRDRYRTTQGQHVEKFKKATFASDTSIREPRASNRIIRPMIGQIMLPKLLEFYKHRYGKDFDFSAGLKAFSTVKDMPNLIADRDNDKAFIRRVMEQKTIQPGESFGLEIPEGWETSYFHAKLGTKEAVEAGKIELSRDGKEWSTLEAIRKGSEMYAGLYTHMGWRFARYTNVSDHAVPIKLDLFKFDIRGARMTEDILLDAIQ